MTVDDVIAAVLYCSRAHPGRIGTGMLRLRHGKTAPDVTFKQRLKISLLLFLCSMLQQDFHVARIRRLAVERIMTQKRAPKHGADHAVLHQVESHAAMLFGDLRTPPAQLLHL